MKMSELSLIKLKIKAKHLAKEPAIIKKEERKLQGWYRDTIRDHRIHDVRNEARATQLAITFIKGNRYDIVEPKVQDRKHPKHAKVAKRVLVMVQKYYNRKVTALDISDWSGGIL